jgi:hypothetical protein
MVSRSSDRIVLRFDVVLQVLHAAGRGGAFCSALDRFSGCA